MGGQRGMERRLDRDFAANRKRRRLPKREFFFFGCTIWSYYILERYKAAGLTPLGFVDNDTRKAGGEFHGYPVYRPDMLKNKCGSVDIVISVTTDDIKDIIVRQLEELGYRFGEDIFWILRGSRAAAKEHDGAGAFLGLAIRRSMEYLKCVAYLRRYPNTERLFLNPLEASGDNYVMGLFFGAFLHKRNITGYTVLCKSGAAVRVLELFGIKSEKTESAMFERLWNLTMFSDELLSRVEPLSAFFHYTRNWIKTGNICPLMKLTAADMFAYDFLGLEHMPERVLPSFNTDEDEIIGLIHTHKLTSGKTVMLAPYAGSFRTAIPMGFWQSISDRLKESGFQVVTNSAGEHEPPVPGTDAVMLPYKDMVPVLNMAGYFIGIRSGLCDIISSSSCNMQIVYEKGYGVNRVDMWGLANMGLRNDINEVLFDGSDIDAKIAGIVNYIINKP